jgi:hypothetical protein
VLKKTVGGSERDSAHSTKEQATNSKIHDATGREVCAVADVSRCGICFFINPSHPAFTFVANTTIPFPHTSAQEGLHHENRIQQKPDRNGSSRCA